MARIILADDDEIVAKIVSDTLIDAGHAVGWVKDGRQALEVIRRRPPDLVILDCNMPEMSGILVLREMRQSPELCDLPALMLTGRQSEQDESIIRYEGADDYMRKPFDPGTLVGRVEALLKGEHRWS